MAFNQEEYYDIEQIKTRLRVSLASSEWKNLLNTDLGENLISFGANVIHLDALAFFGGLDQFFLESVDLEGYLEHIALSEGVVPQTYQSSSISINMNLLSGSVSFGPLDLSISFGGVVFYNIEDITLTTVAQEVVFYQGTPIREASQVGTLIGPGYNFSLMNYPVPVYVGQEIVRKYLVINKKVYVPSIKIESTPSFSQVPVRWSQKDSWENSSPSEKAFVVGKDYIGRYKVLFGDGVFGEEYPVSGIVLVSYLISSGEDVSVSDFTDYTIYKYDSTDITSTITVNNVSGLSLGSSELDFDTLKSQINLKKNSNNSIVLYEDFTNYLDSRYDVVASVVRAERHQSSPTIEYFNTIKYSVKPLNPSAGFNEPDILSHISSKGIQTVEFQHIPYVPEMFNVVAKIKALVGFSINSLISACISGITDEFLWDDIGFEEFIPSARVYTILNSIEGFDTNNYKIQIESVVTAADRSILFDITVNPTIKTLSFVPLRYKVFATATEFTTYIAKDDGFGNLNGDIPAEGKLGYASGVMCNLNETVREFLFTSLVGESSARVLDLRKTTGGLNTVNFAGDEIQGFTYASDIKSLITFEKDTDGGDSYWLRVYKITDSMVNVDSPNYLQRKTNPTLSVEYEVEITVAPGNTLGISGIQYFKGYLYMLWNQNTAADRLYRYRVTSSSIYTYDINYVSGAGYIEMSTGSTSGIVICENIFGTENVLFAATGVGIDVIRDVNVSPSYTADFFSDTGVYLAITTDGLNNLYCVKETTAKFIMKHTEIANTGYSVPVIISDLVTMSDPATVALKYIGLDLKVYTYDYTDKKVYVLDYNTVGQVPTTRVGTTSGSTNSIQTVATIVYESSKVTFTTLLSGVTLYFVPDGDMLFEDFQLAILNDLTVEEND